MLLLSSIDFFQNELFQKKKSGTGLECQTIWIQIWTDMSCSGSKLFAKVISRQQKLPLARKELNKTILYLLSIFHRIGTGKLKSIIKHLIKKFIEMCLNL